MTVLLALDPSIAHVGYAVLKPGAPGDFASRPGRFPRLLAIGTERIPASNEEGSVALETRLMRLGLLVARLRSEYHPTHAVLERPVTSTVYARNRKRGGNAATNAPMRQKQDEATGALWMACHAQGIRAHFAAPIQLRYRTADVLRRMVDTLPNRTSEHARAALALGLAALADDRRRWVA